MNNDTDRPDYEGPDPIPEQRRRRSDVTSAPARREDEPIPPEVHDAPGIGPVMVNRESTGYDLPGARPGVYGDRRTGEDPDEPGDSLSRFITQTEAGVENGGGSGTGIFPAAPRTLLDVGLSKAFLSDLVLKVIHYAGTPSVAQLTRRLGLGQQLVQQIMQGLAEERLVEVLSQSDLYTGNYRYRLSERGDIRVLQALDRTRYAGPAPVTAEQYSEVVRRLHATQPEIRRGNVKSMLEDMVLSAEAADALGRALFSGKTAILYGPSGNGKTSILERFRRSMTGVFLVPYAIYAYGQVIRVFDHSIHEPLDQPEGQNVAKEDSRLDRRWVLVRRPVVTLGADVGKEIMDLAYDPQARFYQAPPHIKAQGGVLMVDDFGRQQIPAKELLTRWLIPMERGWDSLSLATGEKVSVPFQIQLLFATSRRVKEVADPALLRRILYKVRIPGPKPEEFTEILRQLCRKKRIRVEEGALDYVIQRLYGRPELPPQASYARDLVEIVVQSAAYDSVEPVLSRTTFDKALDMFMAEGPEDDEDFDE